MNTQPEALRLADILQHKLPSIECLEVAAAELRRLHALNQELLKTAKLALSEAESWTRDQLEGTSLFKSAMAELDPIRAAIAKAEAV